jgi:hypothetical protein
LPLRRSQLISRNDLLAYTGMAFVLATFALLCLLLIRRWGWLAVLLAPLAVLALNYLVGRVWPPSWIAGRDPRCATMNFVPAALLTSVVAAAAMYLLGGRTMAPQRVVLAALLVGLVAVLPAFWLTLQWVVMVLGCDTL